MSKMPTKEVLKALQLYQTNPNLKVKEICKTTGVSNSSITHIRNKFNIPKRDVQALEENQKKIKDKEAKKSS